MTPKRFALVLGLNWLFGLVLFGFNAVQVWGNTAPLPSELALGAIGFLLIGLSTLAYPAIAVTLHRRWKLPRVKVLGVLLILSALFGGAGVTAWALLAVGVFIEKRVA